MLPYITSNQDVEVNINPSHIVCTFELDTQIQKTFLEKTSGIALA
jgi:hypothetical protein